MEEKQRKERNRSREKEEEEEQRRKRRRSRERKFTAMRLSEGLSLLNYLLSHFERMGT